MAGSSESVETYATADDVEVRWAHELSSEEKALVETRLADVERLIRKRIPDLDDQVLSGDIDEDDLIQVESDAVLRLVRNPEGYLSETDGDYAYTLHADLATGRLRILPEEWELLGVRNRMVVLAPRFDMPV